MSKTILTIIFFFGAIFFSLVYLKPAWQTTKTLQQDNKDLHALSQELSSLIENRDFLLDSINRISKEDLTRIDKSLPQDQEAAPLLSFFEQLSGKSGLVLKNIELSEKVEIKSSATPGQPRPGSSLTPPKPQGGTKEFPINISLFGSYESFKVFLSGLEKSLRIMEVNNLTFSPSGNDNIFSFNLKITTYYQ